VPPRRRVRRQRAGEGFGPAFDVGRKAASDDQPDAAAGAFGIEGRHRREMLAPVFEAGVHRAHQHAIGQCGEAQVERREQVRVGRRHDRSFKEECW